MQGAGCRSRAGLRIAAALGVGAIGCGGAAPALAYTAAGDRLFPATLVLPQIAPNDEVYLNDSTLPLTPAGPGSGKRYNTIDGVFTKTITDRLGIKFEQPYTKLDRVGMRPAYGFQNFEVELKYMAINDIDREFLLSFGLDREFATGAVRVGAAPRAKPRRAYISARGSAISISAICVRSRSPGLAGIRSPTRNRAPMWRMPGWSSITRSPICNRRCRASTCPISCAT